MYVTIKTIKIFEQKYSSAFLQFEIEVNEQLLIPISCTIKHTLSAKDINRRVCTSRVLNHPLKPTCVGTRVAGQSAEANICETTHHPLRANPLGAVYSARTYATGTRYQCACL